LEILHFNDIHSLEERQKEKEDGTKYTPSVARMVSAFKQYNEKKTKIVLFSGNMLFPSDCKYILN